MVVSVFGLGYVGIVSASCFARDGINVIGVDVSEAKVDNINKGVSPIIETGLSDLLSNGIENGRIEATTALDEAIAKSEVSLISVGTPSREDGALDLSFVNKVCEDIAAEVSRTKDSHTIIIRSTVLPGTTEDIKQRLVSKYPNLKLSIGFNPEFLREGTAIKDFDEAPYTIIGTEDQQCVEYIKKLYATIDSPVIETKSSEAELVKYAANSWHATKIAFANEIGRVGKHLRIDSRRVMDILVSDEKLNTSKAYMKPGFAYGGSCLPKDVRAIDYFAKVNNVPLPLLSSLASSNQAQVDLATNIILAKKPRKVGVLGLAFKAGTDDLRESPSVTLAEKLLSKGIEIRILDNAVNDSKLIGSNKEYINSKIPHLTELIVDSPKELIEHSEVIVVTHGAAEFRGVLERVQGRVSIVDLSGLFKEQIEYSKYEGIAW